MNSLAGKVAVVAGASRGGGRGIAVALGELGATVWVTGRTSTAGPFPLDGAPGSVEETAREVTRRGGRGIPVRLDHSDAQQVAALFRRVSDDHGSLDIFVSAVWGGNERMLDPILRRPFQEQPADLWIDYMESGPHAFWLGAREAAGIGSRLIVAITEPVFETAFEGQFPRLAEMFSQMGHSAINALVRGLAADGRNAGIAVIGLLPGFMKTERVEMHLDAFGADSRRQFRYDLAETPEYAGRAIAALAGDPSGALERSGQLVYVADLAETYGFTDADGLRPGNFCRILGLIP